MKHCALITAYKDAPQINRLISRIPEDWGVFIHLDKKSDIKDGEIDGRAVKARRRNVYWGSFAHVEAFLDMMRAAHDDTRSFDYFHLLTGQDYPAVDLRRADDFINSGDIYMSHFPLPHADADWSCWDGGLQFYRYKTFARWTDVRRPIINRMLNRLCKIVQCWKTSSHYMPPYPTFGGSSYMSLPREAVEVLLDGNVAKDLRRRLRYSLDGEETFYQTAILNSHLRDRVVNNDLRFIQWPGPAVLDESSYSAIRHSGALFVRKMESCKSGRLMDLLDADASSV